MQAYRKHRAEPPPDSIEHRSIIEAVKAEVPVDEVARRYTELETVGGRAWYSGRCPLPDHEDRTPSFYVYPPGHWWCYGCCRGGDVLDLEFMCGGHRELREAAIALAMDYGIKLPGRPRSWFAKRERQKPIRDGIEAAIIHVARRRIYRRFFEPLVLATEDGEDRAHDAELFWELAEPLAERLVGTLMRRQG